MSEQTLVEKLRQLHPRPEAQRIGPRGAMNQAERSGRKGAGNSSLRRLTLYRRRSAMSADTLPQGESMEIELPAAGWPLIELGYGRIEVAEGHHEGKPALIFGRNGTGKVGEATPPNRWATHEETLAVCTFANVESIDVVIGKLNALRERLAQVQPVMDEQQERAAFEAAAKGRMSLVRTWDDEGYDSPFTRGAYVGWKLARAAQVQRPPVAPDGYDDLIGDGKRLRFLMADLPSGPLKQARDELLRRMPIMGEGAIRAEIDRIIALKGETR